MRTGAPVNDCGPTEDEGEGGGPERTGGAGGVPEPTGGVGGDPEPTGGVGEGMECTDGAGDRLGCTGDAVKDRDSEWMEISPGGIWMSGDDMVVSLVVVKDSSPGVTDVDMVMLTW